MGSYIGDAKGEPFKEVTSIRYEKNLPEGENWPKGERFRQKNTEG
jgi:hypothetical protein